MADIGQELSLARIPGVYPRLQPQMPIRKAAYSWMTEHPTSGQVSHFTTPFRAAAIALSSVYLIGAVTMLFAPETKGRPLPEE
jgi:hypothetical protein